MTPEALSQLARRKLEAAALPDKAPAMQAYMKSEMPFLGVPAPERKIIARALHDAYTPADARAYREAVLTLWGGRHREEKYLAIALARQWKRFVTPSSLELYEQMVREGAWWDFVDEIASHLVGGALAREPERVLCVMDAWIDDPDLWIRRTALLCQLRRKSHTDEARLFRYCVKRMHEPEFFIRKAIGWALREYAKVQPEAVARFLVLHRESLSGLSYREGAKHLKKQGFDL